MVQNVRPARGDTMRIEGSVAFVTGANRGLGRHLAEKLVARLALDGVGSGLIEVLADDATRQTKAALAADRGAVAPTA
jgi:NAD(P)-dependent dehydrogenase (short-subunit alcohol dehydrogenase family)